MASFRTRHWHHQNTQTQIQFRKVIVHFFKNEGCSDLCNTGPCLLSHPFVQGPVSYESQQLIINQVEVFFPSIYDGDNDIMTDGFLWVMGPNFQIL